MRRLAQNIWPTLILAFVLLSLSLLAPTLWLRWRPPVLPPAADVDITLIERPLSVEEAFAEPPRLENLAPLELSRLIERSAILTTSDVERQAPPIEPSEGVLIPDPDDGLPTPVYVATDLPDTGPLTREDRELAPQMNDPLPLSQMMDATERDGESETAAPTTSTKVAPPPVWPQAPALESQLQRLGQLEPQLAGWTAAVQKSLKDLRNSPALGSVESQTALQELVGLNEQAKRYVAGVPAESTRVRVLRVSYSLARRLAMWNVAYDWATHAKAIPPTVPSREDWNQTYAAVFARLTQDPTGSTWAKYLRSGELRQMASDGFPVEEKRLLARDVLRRMNSPQLTDDQLRFLQQPPFDLLTQQLLRYAAEPLHVSALLQGLERQELQELSANAMPVAAHYEIARWSTDPLEVKLADELNAHYRNANFRIAISGELINRLIPRVNRSYESVDDNIFGASVQGDSETEARLRLVLQPDRRRWRLGLEARGEVASSTASTKGPATFYQDGISSFRARKMLTIDRRNIRLFGAEAEANSENMLKDYQTDYDNIPIFGSIARSIARQQYDEQSWAAKAEVENKIAGRASQELDNAVNQRMQQAKNDLQTKLLAPLQSLDLDPTAVDMETTSDRLIARYRLAGHEQLAASTPRPQAPVDSLVSVQLHQSALNNMLQHLKLDGQQVELRKLYADLAEMFTRKKVVVPDEVPEKVMVTFAEVDALRVDCEKGKVRLSIRLQELSHAGDKSWKNFTVRAYYVPDAEQMNANLVRDGVIELIGKNLRLGDQVALRGIFSKVLSRNRNINLINEQLRKTKELSDLHVSQFAIQDGWMGIALASGHRQPIKPKLTPATEQGTNEVASEPTTAEAIARPSVSEAMRTRRN